jgi:uncharacterized protein YndB with AHSA1/START domain
MNDTDRIEKQIDLKAPVARVWRAVSDPKEFGSWFGISFEGPFVAGKDVAGRLLSPGYDHLTATFAVERVDEAAGVFAFRWHPFAIEPNVDYSEEPMTLVEIRVTESRGGSHVSIVESGFDALPLARRAKAFASNEGGWAIQVQNLAKYVGGTR